ncbi:hypothetical protein OUZ56_007469 [Daphnia magna]|uniref:Uncharacterized protein n=1 Tax=Daphnia magna TaxID=35525 RepID=A0ABR0AA23_9CRUS|nr:hypothetical protein OUZ56_007469 [Daphnia magna]
MHTRWWVKQKPLPVRQSLAPPKWTTKFDALVRCAPIERPAGPLRSAPIDLTLFRFLPLSQPYICLQKTTAGVAVVVAQRAVHVRSK